MLFDSYIDADKDSIVREIQNLVRIRSVEEQPEEGKPFGKGPDEALRYMLQAGRSLGFDTENFDGYAGQIEYGSGQGIVGVLVHVDVVPEGDGWTHPPYSAKIIDGKIYGRGAYDDKGACIAALYALKALRASQIPIRKRIRIIIGANEETGMKDIPYYLTKEREPDMAFSPDAPFPVVYGEKGILELVFRKKFRQDGPGIISRIDGGTAAKIVPGRCSCVLRVNTEEKDRVITILSGMKTGFEKLHEYEPEHQELSVTIIGKEAYGTTPDQGKNAISGMMAFLEKADFMEEELLTFIREYNRKIGEEYDGSALKCNFSDDISTPLTFNTGTVLYENGSIEMKAHIRYPIRTDHEDILRNIRDNFLPGDVSIEIDRLSKAHLIDKESFLVKKLMGIYREATGDTAAEPETMTGGTYARSLNNAVAFGPLFPGEKQMAHSTDEYLTIASILKAAKIYAQAMYELAAEEQ